jgi:hypothetical protein
MPIREGRDRKGSYYQWGKQKKYYFKNESGRKLAYLKAVSQARAIYSSGYKRK